MIADEIKNRISELNKELDTLYKKEAEEKDKNTKEIEEAKIKDETEIKEQKTKIKNAFTNLCALMDRLKVMEMNYKIKYDKPFNTNNDDKYYLNYWVLVDDFRDFYI